MNQCPPGPQVFLWDSFEFFRKFSGIFANECLSPVSMTLAISCSAVPMTPAKNLSPVATTQAINPRNGFSVIAGVVDNTSVADTGDRLSPVTTTPAINLSQVATTPVNNYHR
jgi:hypothetical protein